MATQGRLVFAAPLPTDAEAAALQTVRAYLTRAGTQVASRVLGCPDPTGEVAAQADLRNALLASAALCVGLLDLARDPERRL